MDVFWHYQRARKKVAQKKFRAELRKRGVTLAPLTYIGLGSKVDPCLTLEHGARVGRGSYIGAEPIKVGRYTIIGTGTRLVSSNHDFNRVNMQGDLASRLGLKSPIQSNGPIRIGHGAWLGDLVVVLSGVEIGNGAVVGAGSIVTSDIPPFTIAVGNPARVIRPRFSPEIVERVDGWWDLPEEKMVALFSEVESGLASAPFVPAY